MSAGDRIGHGAAACRRGTQIRGVGLRQNATVDDIAECAAPPSVFLMDSANTSASRIARKITLILLAVVAALILALALIPDSVWRAGIEKFVSTHTARKARIEGEVKVHLFSLYPSISMERFSLSNADWLPERPMIRVQQIEATVSLLSLLRFSPVFPRVVVRSPDIDLQRDAQGRANWDFSSPGARKPAPQRPSKPAHLPAVRQFILSDGKLAARDAIRKLQFKGEISIAERSSQPSESALNLHGSGLLNGKPFDLRVQGGPLVEVDPGKPYDFDAELRAADISLNAHTQIKHPFDFGDVNAKFRLRGKDLADVYYLTGLALPNTPPYDLTGMVVRDRLKFTVEDFKGRLGGSDINGTLAIDADRDRPLLKAELRSSLLNLQDLAAPLGTQASVENKSDTLAQPKGQTSETNPKSKPGKRARNAVAKADLQAADTGYLLPDADLQVNRVRAMDADVKFDAEAIRTAKVPMKKVRMHILLNNGRLSVDPLEFTLPEGRFLGTVAVDARSNIPVSDIDMKFEHLDLAQFKPQGSSDAPFTGHLTGRIRLHGSGTSVHKAAADADGDLTLVIPDGEIRAAYAELTGINVAKGLGLLLTNKEQKAQIRCGIASFHAEKGDLKANRLLIDTTNVLVSGRGDVNLTDEGLHLSLTGKPKEIRFVRLRSPIEIHGTLAHPEIGLEPGHVLAQAGSAAVLGTLLTPVAAVLAFVDKGLAKDANCAALTQETEQNKSLPPANP
jgi:AsmA family protein